MLRSSRMCCIPLAYLTLLPLNHPLSLSPLSLPPTVSPHSPDARECVQHGAGGTVCAALLQPTHPSPLSPPPLLCRSSIPCMYVLHTVPLQKILYATKLPKFHPSKVFLPLCTLLCRSLICAYFCLSQCIMNTVVAMHTSSFANKGLSRNSLLILLSLSLSLSLLSLSLSPPFPPLPASRAECCTT